MPPPMLVEAGERPENGGAPAGADMVLLVDGVRLWWPDPIPPGADETDGPGPGSAGADAAWLMVMPWKIL